MPINKHYVTRLSAFLVVTILFVSVLLMTPSANGAAPAGTVFSTADRVIDKTFDAQPGGLFQLESRVGTVEIQGWNRDEVRVKIEVTGRESYIEDVEFFIDSTPDGVSIKATIPRTSSWFGWSGHRLSVAYYIQVPFEYNTDIKTGGGGIKISQIDGNIAGKTAGGGIRGEELSGIINLSTSGGGINMKKVRGDVSVSTSGGSIDVDGMSGDLNVRTSGGPIRLNVTDARVIARTSGGGITLRLDGENKGIDLNTSGGGITVHVPEDIRANVSARTSGGSVSFDMPVTVRGSISRSSVEGTINDGGPEIRLRTSGGSIRIKKIN